MTLLAGTALLACGIALLSPTQAVAQAAPVAAETAAAAAKDPKWKAPRTSWGQPSFEGTWTTDDMHGIDLERPDQFGSRLSLTPEELAERIKTKEAVFEEVDTSRSLYTRLTSSRAFGFTSLLIDPPNGKLPAYTPAAAASENQGNWGTYGAGPFDSGKDFFAFERCMTRGILGSILPAPYGNGMRVIQTPDKIAFTFEMVHDTRIIPLDGRPFPHQAIRQYMGSGRAHWEGDTLVVETRNLTDKTGISQYNGKGIFHSKDMVITERWTRIDPNMIQYVATVVDPATYVAPFTIRLVYGQDSEYKFYDYACHEDNQAITLSLSGERAHERKVAEARAAGLPIPERRGGGLWFGEPGDDEGALPDSDEGFIDIASEE